METASFSVLEYAAKYKDSLLLNRYKAGRDQIARGLKSPPYGSVIPQDQRDVVAAVELLRRLAFGGVRVSTLTDRATIEGKDYPAGTWIVSTDQEFAALAREEDRAHGGRRSFRNEAALPLRLRPGVSVDSNPRSCPPTT